MESLRNVKRNEEAEPSEQVLSDEGRRGHMGANAQSSNENGQKDGRKETITVPVGTDRNLKTGDAWPPYESMSKSLEEALDQCIEPSMDMPTLEVSQHSLMESRAAANGEQYQQQEQEGTMDEARQSIESEEAGTRNCRSKRRQTSAL